MPEGVPVAALRPEPSLPAPAEWPYGEDFPRTCGTGRLAGGAVFWTDFLYDDHGARGIRWDLPSTAFSPPGGTYTYPDGPAAGNGADIFRTAIGLTETDSWWRVDWNTLLEPSVPIALFTMDTSPGQPGAREWPAGAGIRSAGIDLGLLVSGQGAWLIDVATGERQALEHFVDMEARSFLARLPRSSIDPTGTWTVRLAAGLANDAGDGFADVDADLRALPGQTAVYNLAFRTHEQEQAHLNFWSDAAQAEALTDGDVSAFSLGVSWDALAAGTTSPEPLVRGTSTRWHVSSLELGQGVAEPELLSTEPRFLGRVQPYSVCLPSTYAPGRKLPLTLLLHSLTMGHNQFAAIDPSLLHGVCDGRDSIVATPLARGPASWYFDEGELDVWEVWARVSDQLGADPDRTVIAGYSMGGYAAYKLGLSYPEVFAQAVVFAGPPTCGIRILPGVDIPATLDPDSHCAQEGDTWPLLPNARWLPFVIVHGAGDQLVPIASVVDQALELDRLGYRFRFTVYPLEDHLGFALKDEFDDAVAHMGTDPRQPDPGHISFTWYPALVRPDLGIGPHRAWWLSELAATHANRGEVAEVDARSYARPDPTRTTYDSRGVLLSLDPSPGFFTEQTWDTGTPPQRLPILTLRLHDVASLTVDLLRAGFTAGEQGSIKVATNAPTVITLERLAAATPVWLDGAETGTPVAVPEGRHEIRFG
jgi:pimeloyl-ACP methyl ester carboxylesterase